MWRPISEADGLWHLVCLKEACAELALFLYDDPEMHHVARDIAAVCDPIMVIRKGGAKGIALLAAADEASGYSGSLPPCRLITSRWRAASDMMELAVTSADEAVISFLDPNVARAPGSLLRGESRTRDCGLKAPC